MKTRTMQISNTGMEDKWTEERENFNFMRAQLAYSNLI